MQIAILLTSNDTSEFARRFPDDGEKFITLLSPLAPGWQFSVYPVFEDVFPGQIETYDGIIITGSPASVRDPHPWVARLLDLIREVDEKKLPLVGVCFGHQAIALALGGEIGYNPHGWTLGTEQTHFTRRKPWMEPFQPALTLHAAHKEQVLEAPAGAEILGHAEGCPVAAFAIGDYIMTTEYHPEMQRDFMEALVVEMGDAVTPDLADRARQQIAAGEEGALFAKWMVAFFESKAT